MGCAWFVPVGWHRMAATPSSITDPLTLLVVGTTGVKSNVMSMCQIAAYRVPARAAAVVVVGWKTATSGGGSLTPGQAPTVDGAPVTWLGHRRRSTPSFPALAD